MLGRCTFGECREWLRGGEERLVQRFDPCGPHDTMGFFIAKFRAAPGP